MGNEYLMQFLRDPKQKILFTSIIGPYGEDTHRSRFKNPMSLLSNQITRGQKYYTVRMCQRTFAFDLFATNLNADVAVLNFPSEKQLAKVLKAGHWDRVGLSAIVSNFESLLDTYQLVRKYLPTVPIDIGGHICNDENVVRELVERMHAIFLQDNFRIFRPEFEEKHTREQDDSVTHWLEREKIAGTQVTFVKRDGLEYYAQLDGVGLKSKSTLYAPLVEASFGKRVFGIPVPSTSAGLLIPDVGCPMKCNFCATSHKFNGKFVPFLKTAEDIMQIANAHADLGREEMFVMSENFSLDTRRCLKLLGLMEQQKRPHKFNVFSSANGLIKLGIENIIKLGYCFIWIGLEELTGTTFQKTHGIALKELVADLQKHGVEILGSTILGFEHHTFENIDREIAHALTFDCVYNQFMLYMPVPGTAFWDKMKSAGKLKKNFSWLEIHGQAKQNWHHPHLDEGTLEARLDRAFTQDFEELGPSLYRMMKVHYQGYVTTRDWDHELVQMRRINMKAMFLKYLPLLTAMHRDLKGMRHRRADQILELRDAMLHETGKSGRWLNRLSPLFSVALQIEKFRYNRWQKIRRIPGPRATLTHYGEFSWKYPLGVPKIEPGRMIISIPTPHRYYAPKIDSHVALASADLSHDFSQKSGYKNQEARVVD